METRKEMILTALDAFVRQRSGMDARNYITPGGPDPRGVAAYRADVRGIGRDLRDYRALRLVVGWRTDITADDLVAAFRDAYSGRLVLRERQPVGSIECFVPGYALDYCTGQYFPMEYRKAACAVLASALWARKRAETPSVGDGTHLGDWLRASFRKEFGRGIASRWFS